VTGIVPIALESGIEIQSGTLNYYPANNPNNVTPLPITSQLGTISSLDTTTLSNGTYWIQLQATNTSGEFEYSLILVTVAGNYKPGRVTATVTDLVVPATGLAINIQRTYDSLNAGTSGDFGYGWNLGINVNLTVGPDGSVTFTLGGQRRTFYLTPQPNGFLPYYDVAFTPEPGFHGTLTDSAPGCQDLFDFVVPSGSLWYCVDGGQYNPPGYIYTDPSGTSYVIGSGGQLQAIQDRSGNGLTITPTGIVSSTGLKVPFKRDAQNRIYEIDDPQGNQYLYGYNAKGELDSVTYPNTTQPSTYAYTSTGHYYLSGTDFRNNPLPVTAYYDSATDGGNAALDGRLASVQDAVGNTTSYAYNLATNSTTITYPDNGVATMVYDSYGMLLSSTDPLGLTTTNVYDSKHNLTSVTDPLGHVNTYTYDQNGNKTSSTYPATATSTNTTSTTAYNQYSEPTQTTDELGNVRVFNYDANYNPQSVSDSLGTLASFIFNPNQTLQAGAIGFDISVNPAQASQFAYDANGNMIGRTDALGRTTSYVYNSLGQKISAIQPTPTSLVGGTASTTNYTYDQLGNLTETAAPLSRITNSAYDGNGNKVSDTDARGNVTKYQYDALNRLIETDYPDGAKATKTYDFRNNVVNETDQNGNVTQHTYDLAGRPLSLIRGYGTSSASTTTYAYDNAGRKTSETDALGHSTAYTYDADNRLIAIAGVKGNFTYAYDDAGNRIAQTDANGNKTHFQYDARKRLTTTTYPDHTTTVNSYDGPGNLASVTDQAGNVVQYTYDAANQLKTVVQTASPNTTNNTNSYGYDPLGNLTALSDENLHTTQNLFDLYGEPVQKTLPDQTLTETRSYDPAGNLISLQHFNGVTTTYAYDQLNRLLSRVTPGEPAVSFTYSATGKRATMSDGSGTTTYSYDSLDRLTSKATPEGTLTYGYDAASNVASVSSNHVNGVSVSYAYDQLNRLSSVTDGQLQGNQTTTYTYDPASNLSAATYPNGVQSAMTYDALNRITGLATQSTGYLYQRGATGNLTGATELNGRTLAWNYDGIYRLTNETMSSDPSNNNGSSSYTLDPVGNRLAESTTLPGLSSGSFGYNADDEVNTETYDANGNATQVGAKSFTYDSENHMTSMSGGGTVVTMIYDGDGNRVSKTVGGVTTQYLVDDMNPTGYAQVVEELVGGAVTRQYTYGLQRISQQQFISNVWTPSFFGYDGGGNVRTLTNSAGAITDEYLYDAFGNSFTKTGTTPNNYLYRGEQYDGDLGLYYLRARY
jgi:YD repeat-containing protein